MFQDPPAHPPIAGRLSGSENNRQNDRLGTGNHQDILLVTATHKRRRFGAVLRNRICSTRPLTVAVDIETTATAAANASAALVFVTAATALSHV